MILSETQKQLLNRVSMEGTQLEEIKYASKSVAGLESHLM
jgi:hypothetical protein